MPPKTILRTFEYDFLLKRQGDLQKWLQEVIGDKSQGVAQNFYGDALDSDILRRFLTHMANQPPPLEESSSSTRNSSSASSGSTGNTPTTGNTKRNDDLSQPEEEGELEMASAKLAVGDFDLLRVVGKGSFGKVMLVRKKDTTELFAMKVLSKPTVVKKNQVEHTRTERRVLGSVKHPFVVRLVSNCSKYHLYMGLIAILSTMHFKLRKNYILFWITVQEGTCSSI